MKRKQATAWRRGFVAAFGVCILSFAANATFSEIRPGNAWGLAYGVGAATLMLAAALYGMRRRTMPIATRMGLGTARSWLYLHIYGGSLFLVLMLMHSGFRLPRGTTTGWLWGLSLWTVASGLLGLALQQWIPRVLGSALSVEVLYERIPELVDEVRAKAESCVASCSEPVKRLYAARLAPTFEGPRRRWIYFADVTGDIQSHLKDLHYLKGLTSAEEQEKLTELAALYEAKLELDAHYTLQLPLRCWLYSHVPLSLVLVAFLVLHVFAVLYY